MWEITFVVQSLLKNWIEGRSPLPQGQQNVSSAAANLSSFSRTELWKIKELSCMKSSFVYLSLKLATNRAESYDRHCKCGTTACSIN
jgi:hypothetical protein